MKKELYAIFLAIVLLIQSAGYIAIAEEVAPEDREYDHLNKQITTFIKGNLLPPSEDGFTVEGDNTNYDYAYEKLLALGILDGSGNQSLSSENPLTRIEFLNIIMSCMGISGIANAETGFIDVSAEHEHSGIINVARSYGIVKGSGGFFRPDAPVTYAEAIVMAVRAFGHGLEADAAGGFEAGYIAIAMKYDLLTGIDSVDYFSTTDKKEAYRLILNLVEADELSVLQVKKDGVYYVNPGYNTTMLEHYWDFEYSEGVVTSVGLSGLYSDTNDNPDVVVINNLKLLGDYSQCVDLLGMYSKAWYDPDTSEIIFIEALEKRNLVMTIDSKDAVGLSSGSFRYFDGNREKSIPVIRNPYVIYNGRLASSSIENLYTPDQGTVTFINNTGSGAYNIIKIESYTDMVVGMINSNDMIVYDAYSSQITELDNTLINSSKKPSGYEKAIELNSDKMMDGLSIVNDLHKEIYFGMLSENDVITIKKSIDSKLVYVYVSSNTVKGRIGEIYESDGKRYVRVNGKEYKLTERCKELCKDSIQLNADVILRLNKFGNVVAIGTADGVENGMQYAYVIRTFIEEMAADGPLMYLRLLKADGKIANFALSEKCRIDGAVKKEADKQEDAFELGVVDDNSRVIRYELDDDSCIKTIDTEYCADSESEESTIKALRKVNGTEITFKDTGMFDEQVWIDHDNTIVFAINSSNTVAESEKYRVMKTSLFKNDDKYDVNAYTSNDSYVADVITTNLATEETVSDRQLAIVSKIGQVWGDGELMAQFKVYVNGAEKTITCDAEEFAKHNIVVGDIIRYDAVDDVILGTIEKVYDSITKTFPVNTDAGTNGFANTSSSYRAGDFLVRKGFVYDVKGEYFSFVLTDDVNDLATFNPKTDLSDMVVTKMNSAVSIYKMDSKGLTVTTGSIKDLKPYVDCGNSCNAVIYRSMWMQPQQFIIIEDGEAQK